MVPVYNRQDFLGQTLQSLVNQTYKNFEVLVIDDQSTDNSVLVAAEFLNRLDLQIIRLKQNSGESNAVNIGWKASKNNLIAIVNSDDPQNPDWLENIKIEILKNPGWCFYYPNRKVIDYTGAVIREEILPDWSYHLIYEELNPVASVGAIYDRNFFPDDFLPRNPSVVFPSDLIQMLEMCKYGRGHRVANYFANWREHGEGMSAKLKGNVKAVFFEDAIRTWINSNQEFLNQRINIRKTHANLILHKYYLLSLDYHPVFIFVRFIRQDLPKLIVSDPVLFYHFLSLLISKIYNKLRVTKILNRILEKFRDFFRMTISSK